MLTAPRVPVAHCPTLPALSKLLCERSNSGREGSVYQFSYFYPALIWVVTEYQGNAVSRRGPKQWRRQRSIVIGCRAWCYCFGKHCYRKHSTLPVTDTLDDNHEPERLAKHNQLQSSPPTTVAKIREEVDFPGSADYLLLPVPRSLVGRLRIVDRRLCLRISFAELITDAGAEVFEVDGNLFVQPRGENLGPGDCESSGTFCGRFCWSL